MVKKAFPDELIGEEVEVIDSGNKANVGIRGKVIDETKMTIKINQAGKSKVLMKNNIILKLSKTGRNILGRELIGRPEERAAK